MSTCSKCFKPNPKDAVFCGFCGGSLEVKTPPATSDKDRASANKTMFGYNVDAKAMVEQAARAAAKPDPGAGPSPSVAATVPVPDIHELAVKSTKAPAQAQASRNPTVIGEGRYQVERLRREVAAGRIVVATDTKQAGKKVDIILPSEAAFQSPLDLERARRELRQLQRLEHPSIVQVIDHLKSDDGGIHVVMEHVEGEWLDEVVARQPVSFTQAQEILRSIGAGLAEAQKLGVIHRDIAPHNVLCASDGTCKLWGFGIAPTVSKQIAGTPEFMSPEQACGRPVDQRSNIYSLGVLMFYMLTGKPPFYDGDTAAILAKHQQEEPPSPSAVKPDVKLPDRAEALMLKAMAKSSSRRHLTLRQFLRELEAIAGDPSAPSVAAVPSNESKPPSFETPLHGVTALTAGQAPPPVAVPPPAIMAAASVPLPPAAHAAGAGNPQAEDPSAPPPPNGGGRQRQAQVTGEMSSHTALKQPEPLPPEELARQAQRKASGPPVPQAPDKGAGKGAKPGFRETMWFFKGEVESAMASEGSEAAAKQPPAEVVDTPEELTAKYQDDGSLTDTEAKRLSLRTGKTQMMQRVEIPKGDLPGDKMRAEEFIGEMNRGRRIAIWVGVGVIGLVALVTVLWLVVRG